MTSNRSAASFGPEARLRSYGIPEPGTFAIVPEGDGAAVADLLTALEANGLRPDATTTRTEPAVEGDTAGSVRWSNDPLRALLDLPVETGSEHPTTVRAAIRDRFDHLCEADADEEVFAALLGELVARPALERPYGDALLEAPLSFVHERPDGSVRNRWVTLWEVFEFTPIPRGGGTSTLRELAESLELDTGNGDTDEGATRSTAGLESDADLHAILSALLDTPIDDFDLALTFEDSFAVPVDTDGEAFVPRNRMGTVPLSEGDVTLRAVFDCDLASAGEPVALFDRGTAVATTRSEAYRRWYDKLGGGFVDDMTHTVFDMPLEIEDGGLREGKLYDGPELVTFSLWAVADQPLLLDEAEDATVLEDVLDARIDVAAIGLDASLVRITVRDIFEHDFREFGEYTGAPLADLFTEAVVVALPTIAIGARWVIKNPDLVLKLVEVVLDRYAKRLPESDSETESETGAETAADPQPFRMTFVVGETPVVIEGSYEDVRRYEREGLNERWLEQLQDAAGDSRAASTTAESGA